MVSEQITLRGVGNGISLIIFSGIVAEIPRALASTFELGRAALCTDDCWNICIGYFDSLIYCLREL